MSSIPAKIATAVKSRSNLLCETCAKSRGEHLHHRKLRSQGGQHTVVNLLHCCGSCHSRIHAHPAESYLRGLLVRSFDDPELVPVVPFFISEGVAS